MTPQDFFKSVITRWEGLYQNDPNDAANWVRRPDGMYVNLGTMRGVTPATLAAYRGVAAWTLTVADMLAVTLDDAADIGLKLFYEEPNFDQLDWGPATAAVVDFGWGSGTFQAALSMQRLIGVYADGIVGPVTTRVYDEWAKRLGPSAATTAVRDMREAFYRYICIVNPVLYQYLDGWINRADWVSPKNSEFWSQWPGQSAPMPTGQLSPHFSLGELEASDTARRLGLDNSAPPTIIGVMQHKLAPLLEQVRSLLGDYPVTVTSGYRSPQLNSAVGGVPDSDHTRGMAADIVVPGYGSPLEVCRAIVGSGIFFGQLIHEQGNGGAWTHISVGDQRQVLHMINGVYLRGLP